MNKATDKPEGLLMVEYRKNMRALLRKSGFEMNATATTETLERMIQLVDHVAQATGEHDEYLQYKREIMGQDEHEEVA